MRKQTSRTFTLFPTCLFLFDHAHHFSYTHFCCTCLLLRYSTNRYNLLHLENIHVFKHLHIITPTQKNKNYRQIVWKNPLNLSTNHLVWSLASQCDQKRRSCSRHSELSSRPLCFRNGNHKHSLHVGLSIIRSTVQNSKLDTNYV